MDFKQLFFIMAENKMKQIKFKDPKNIKLERKILKLESEIYGLKKTIHDLEYQKHGIQCVLHDCFMTLQLNKIITPKMKFFEDIVKAKSC